MSTGHANSPIDMLNRLETMVLMGVDMPISAIRGQIAAGIDVIVHLGRLRDQSRKVLEVVEVLEYNNNVISTNLLYKFKEDKLSDSLINNSVNGVLEWTGNGLNNTQKMLSAGYHEEAIEYGKRS